MFGKILDLGVKNDFMGAFLFYLTNLVLLAGVSTVMVYVLGHVGLIGGGVGGFFEGGHIHTVIGSLFILWLGGSILHHKGLTGDLMSIIVVMVGLYLGWTTSVLLGLVPIALLTTMVKK